MENINILGELYVLKDKAIPIKSQDETEPILRLLQDNIGLYLYNDYQSLYRLYVDINFINRFADSLLNILNNSTYIGEYAINTKGSASDFTSNKHLILYQNTDYVIAYNENYDNDPSNIPIKIFKSNIKDWVMLNDKREIFTDKRELYRITYINKNNNSFGTEPNKFK